VKIAKGFQLRALPNWFSLLGAYEFSLFKVNLSLYHRSYHSGKRQKLTAILHSVNGSAQYQYRIWEIRAVVQSGISIKINDVRSSFRSAPCLAYRHAKIISFSITPKAKCTHCYGQFSALSCGFWDTLRVFVARRHFRLHWGTNSPKAKHQVRLANRVWLSGQTSVQPELNDTNSGEIEHEQIPCKAEEEINVTSK